jgi:hypothetical protein
MNSPPLLVELAARKCSENYSLDITIAKIDLERSKLPLLLRKLILEAIRYRRFLLFQKQTANAPIADFD